MVLNVASVFELYYKRQRTSHCDINQYHLRQDIKRGQKKWNRNIQTTRFLWDATMFYSLCKDTTDSIYTPESARQGPL
jgi:hypothetical protein